MQRKRPDMISLVITTRCSRQCEHCAFKYPNQWDASIDYIRTTMATVGDLRRLHIAGGEPTEHPSFDLVVEQCVSLRRSGQCGYLTIETARWHPRVLRFDEVFFSDYGDNKRALAEYEVQSCIRLHAGAPNHLPDVPGNGEVCHRGLSENVVVYRGRVYPCCASVCVPGVKSVPLTPHWCDDILQVAPPCAACRFSGSG